jgi:NADPH-dependent glutamate synthase beta subunit-like oxidoreductase
MLTLQAPHHIEKDASGNAIALWTKPQIIGEISESGRTEVRDSQKDLQKIDCDYIIVAIGQAIDLKSFEGVKATRSTFATENSSFVPDSGNVFAGGDAVSGPATVIKAVAAGKVAADNIDEFLGFDHKIISDIEIPAPALSNKTRCGRVNLATKMHDKIENNFDLVAEGMSHEEACQECSRCLRCDHFGYGIFREGRNIEW